LYSEDIIEKFLYLYGGCIKAASNSTSLPFRSFYLINQYPTYPLRGSAIPFGRHGGLPLPSRLTFFISLQDAIIGRTYLKKRILFQDQSGTFI
jgi:hypothetical protein